MPSESTETLAVSVVPLQPDQVPPVARDKAPRPRLGWAMAILLLAGGLLFIAGPQDARTPDEPQPDGIFLVVPDVVGMDVVAAEQLLASAGFTRDTVRRWTPNQVTAAGTILAQSPERGLAVDAPIALEISRGGPTISFESLPSSARDLAASSTIDGDAPILVLATAAGNAYKSGDLLFGACAATDLVPTDVPRAEVRCEGGATTTVEGWLPDGTKFSLSGLPEGQFSPEAIGGTVMVDLADGSSRPLGLQRSAAVTADGSVTAEGFVEWFEGGRLEIVGGAMRLEIDVDRRVLDLLGSDGEQTVLSAIHPSDVDGFLIIDLSAPLRWQLPGEVPDAISVDLGDVVVERGCSGADCATMFALSARADSEAIDLNNYVLAVLVDPATFAANPWVLAFELTFPDGGRWLLRLETKLSMDVVGVSMSGSLLADGERVADANLAASPAWPLDLAWDPGGALPQRIETHDRLDGALAETWWLTPDDCCGYLTFVAAPDGRAITWASDALIDVREDLVDAVVWAPDRVSFDSTRFRILPLSFAIHLETRDGGQPATVFVTTPCERGLVGQAPCDLLDAVGFDANGLPFSEVRIRPLEG